jgi:hypothetical protein
VPQLTPARLPPDPPPPARYYVREVQEASASQVELFLNSVPILSPLTRDDKLRLVDALETKVGLCVCLCVCVCGGGDMVVQLCTHGGDVVVQLCSGAAVQRSWRAR